MVKCPGCGSSNVRVVDYDSNRSRDIGYKGAKWKKDTTQTSRYTCNTPGCLTGIFEGVHADALYKGKFRKPVISVITFGEEEYQYKINHTKPKVMFIQIFGQGCISYNAAVFGDCMKHFQQNNVTGEWIGEWRIDKHTNEPKLCFNEVGEVFSEDLE